MKKLKRKIDLRTVAVLMLAVGSGVMLLHVSQLVQSAEDELSYLARSSRTHEDGLRVLNAEWSYLSSPKNLESLARDNLELVPINPDVMTDDEMPVPHKIMPAGGVETQPVSAKVDLEENTGGAQ